MKKIYIIIATLVIMVVHAVALYAVLDNPLICHCGYVQVFDVGVKSSQNSQHLLDWYSFSHLITGFLLYLSSWVIRKKFPKIPIGALFIVAVIVSTGWEIFENTHYAVRHLQENTVSTEYQGDSVLNSTMDTVATIVGFWVAFAIPVWATVIIIILLEVVVLVMTRNDFTLSIIMFFYSNPALLDWQKAALTR